jgi:Domain of unknown function (DUF4920)
MGTLKLSFASILLTAALFACAKESPPEPARKDTVATPATPAPTTPPAPAPVVQKNLALGAPIPAGTPMVALSDVAKNPSAYDGKSITTTGTVTSVCQSMGCWMEIKDDSGQAHIKMAGHGFFVPKTASGHKAKVMATLASEPDSCGEDDCKPKAGAKPAAGKDGQLAKLQLVATGVELD